MDLNITVSFTRSFLVFFSVECDECKSSLRVRIMTNNTHVGRVETRESGLDFVRGCPFWDSGKEKSVAFALDGRRGSSNEQAAAIQLNRICGFNGGSCSSSRSEINKAKAPGKSFPAIHISNDPRAFHFPKPFESLSKSLASRFVIDVPDVDGALGHPMKVWRSKSSIVAGEGVQKGEEIGTRLRGNGGLLSVLVLVCDLDNSSNF
jgi:hypothetical protein